MIRSIHHSTLRQASCLLLLSCFGSLALTLSSCAPVGPDYKQPETSVPSDYKFKTVKNGEKAASREQWWKVFNDSKLNAIIKDVRASNQEIRASYARYQQSRSNLKATTAKSKPTLSFSPSIQHEGSSGELNDDRYTHTVTRIPINSSWELDLFGSIKRQTEASVADSQVAAEELNNLRLTLEADAAIRYFRLRSIDKEIAIVKEEIKGRENTLLVIEDRFSVGSVSKLDVSRAKSELAITRANLTDLHRSRSTEEAAIALLCGKPASNYSIAYSPLVSSVPRIPSSLPSELLRSRPDIRAAERQVAGANARIGVATAAFYPSISLTGNVGTASASLNTLFSRRSSIWSIGPEVYLPIFGGGSNKAALSFSKAHYEEVLANYQQAVLLAISEVETRLSATQELNRKATAQSDAVTAAREARLIAKEQYNGGVTNYLSVLDAERTAFDIERSRAQTLGAEYINTINLIRALGGRW